ncbi:MAG: stage III sporulation protein AC [Clostridia bacterium]|nr:stage III sporulation protein AC [Clostridia bacterium]
MGVDLIFKIAAIGITVTVLQQLLMRSGREDQAMLTTLAGLIVVLLMVLSEVKNLFDTIKTLFDL